MCRRLACMHTPQHAHCARARKHHTTPNPHPLALTLTLTLSMSAAAYPPTPQRSLGPPQEPLVEGGEAKLDGMTMGMTPIHASRER